MIGTALPRSIARSRPDGVPIKYGRSQNRSKSQDRSTETQTNTLPCVQGPSSPNGLRELLRQARNGRGERKAYYKTFRDDAMPSTKATCEFARWVVAVAVGTVITDRPPHRSVRALLRIRLPPPMTGIKALHRIRMEDSRDWNPFCREPGEPVQGNTTALAAPR